jgi:hypothetical protein
VHGRSPRASGVFTPSPLPPGPARLPRLKQQPGVDPARVCVAGFCFGGASALRYAASHPGEAAAVAVFYGRPLEGGGSGLYAPLAGVPVYAVYGSRDNQFPPEAVDGFEVAGEGGVGGAGGGVSWEAWSWLESLLRSNTACWQGGCRNPTLLPNTPPPPNPERRRDWHPRARGRSCGATRSRATRSSPTSRPRASQAATRKMHGRALQIF